MGALLLVLQLTFSYGFFFFFFNADLVLSTFKEKNVKVNGGLVFAIWAFCFCINSLSQTFLLWLKNVHY